MSFNFGGFPTTTAPSAQPPFSFGSAAAPAASTQPGFSFGSVAAPATSTQPAFSFGSVAAPPISTQPPAFGFGSVAAPVSSTQPAFGFGSVAAPTTSTQPAFGFGSVAGPATATQPALNFGAAAPSTSATSGFAIPTTTTSAGALGLFGSKAQTAMAPGTLGGFTGFGTLPTSTAQPASSVANIFPVGTGAAPTTKTALPAFPFASNPTPGLGVSSTGGTGLFGTQAPTTTASTAVGSFGPATGSTTALGTGTTGLFSAPSTSAVGLVAPSLGVSTSTGMFGPTTVTNTGLFGTGSTVVSGTTPASTTLTGTFRPGIPATAAGFSFGTTPSTSLAANTSASTSLTFTLPTTTTSALKLGGTTGTQPAFALKLGATATTITPSTAITTVTAASSVASVTMTYKQLEEAINKWALELEEQQKVFLQQATQVNGWDKLLIENGEKIEQLNADVERVKIDQQRLDQELDFIASQQRELEDMLNSLETSVNSLPQVNYQQHSDLERDHTYQLAQNIDAQLKRMAQDLKKIVDHVNTANTPQDTNDPVIQIAKILNAHMDSLQWIDQNTAALQRRVDEVSKIADQQRKEQERNFRLAYD